MENNAAIITIGDELLIGQTIDTNSAYIAKELNLVGIWVRRRIAVGDDYNDIWQALEQEAENAGLIIITGGLGPTADDITKPLLCDYFNAKMVRNDEVLAHIKHLFTHVIHRPEALLLQRNAGQAMVPGACTVLHNETGTAPGMWFEKINKQGKNVVYISLPGVPHEMKNIFAKEVMPRLQQRFSGTHLLHKTLVTYGAGESTVAERLMQFEAALPAHITLAYLPHFGQLKLRLTAKGSQAAQLESEAASAFQQLKHTLADIVIAEEDISLAAIIAKHLTQHNKTLSMAESCTGGYLAHLFTAMPGASAFYKGSIIAYANTVKEALLHVSPATLKQYGAVSEATAREMAVGILQQTKSDYAIATTGIMGPGGGSTEKPVGLVWIAVGDANNIHTYCIQLRYGREKNIENAAMHALNFLRAYLFAKP